MDPSTLEMLLMLRLNRDSWSKVQDVVEDGKVVNRERARLRAEAIVAVHCSDKMRSK